MKTLADVRAFLAHEASRLDPTSRYVHELRSVIDSSLDIGELVRRLDAGCRGKFWAGDAVFSSMSLAEKLRANLVTNETALMRFDAPELDFLRVQVLPKLRHVRRMARILSLPCSHGEEAVSLASECLDAGMSDFTVHGADAQRACIASANSGVIPFPGLPKRVRCVVDAEVMRHLAFWVADAFKSDLGGPYDLIVCRNFLGYFRPHLVRQVLQRLCAVMRANESFLLVDTFILDKHPDVFDNLPIQRIDGVPAFCALTA